MKHPHPNLVLPLADHPTVRPDILLAIAFAVGLAARAAMLFHAGTGDMIQYHDWGCAVLDRGLADAFRGIYFPLQYQVFEACAWLERSLGTGAVFPFKLANLGFDVATFFLLQALLRRINANPRLALLYWFHPWFLSMFSCGYVDVQYTFFALLTVCFLLAGEDWRHYLLAGLPLGITVLMKPQALILVVTAAVFGVFLTWRTRRPAPALGLLAGPALLFGGYSLLFFAQQKPIWHLAWSYVRVAATMPVLSANMPNPWYVVAWWRLPAGVPIYTASARDAVLGPLTFHFLAMILTALVMLTVIAWFVVAGRRTVANQPLILCLAFGSLAVPFLMTAAHENHAFGATVLLLLLIPILRDRIFTWSVHGLWLLLFLNVFLIYDPLGGALHAAYTPGVRALLAVYASLLFLVVNWRLLHTGIDRTCPAATGRDSSRTETSSP